MNTPVSSLNEKAHPHETYPQPSAESGGVSFKYRSFAPLVITATVTGTPIVSAPVPMQPFQNVTFVFPVRVTPAESLERYEKRRREMVAAGIQPLNDEEVREEIRDRKGADEP